MIFDLKNANIIGMTQNLLQKGVLHNILLQKRAEILHLFVFMVVFVAILNLFANTPPIPNTMPNFASARLLLILGYSTPAIRPIPDILGCSHTLLPIFNYYP